MNSARRTKLIALFVAVASAVLVIGFWVDRRHAPVDNGIHVDDTPSQSVFSDTANLPDILSVQQLNAFYQNMILFSRNTFNGKADKIKVVGQAKIARSGVISVILRVEPAAEQFAVALDRNTIFNKLIISIPSHNYKEIVLVY